MAKGRVARPTAALPIARQLAEGDLRRGFAIAGKAAACVWQRVSQADCARPRSTSHHESLHLFIYPKHSIGAPRLFIVIS